MYKRQDLLWLVILCEEEREHLLEHFEVMVEDHTRLIIIAIYSFITLDPLLVRTYEYEGRKGEDAESECLGS